MKTISAILLLVILSLQIFSCSTVESAGEGTAHAGRSAGRAVGDAAEAIGDGAGEVVGAVGDSVENAAKRTEKKGY